MSERAPRLAPGQLFVHPATAAWDLEWLVVTREGNDPFARLGIVAVDTFPAGRTGCDVEVPAGRTGGPLWLRCDRVLGLVARTVEAAAETSGEVDPEALGAARTALASAPVAEDELGLEHGELAGWLRTEVEPAREQLVAIGSASSSPNRPRPSWLRTAAVFAGGLLGGAFVVGLAQQGELERLRRTLAATDAASSVSSLAEPQTDLTLAVLHPIGALRSAPVELPRPGAGALIVLTLLLEPESAGQRQELRLLRLDPEALVWESHAVVPNAQAELRLAIPGHQLPPGRYRLEARPLEPGTAVPTHFELAIVGR